MHNRTVYSTVTRGANDLTAAARHRRIVERMSNASWQRTVALEQAALDESDVWDF